MNRRGAVVGIVGAFLLPECIRAADTPAVRRIGLLGLGEPNDQEEATRFWAPARELGWVEGRNLVVERRWTTDSARLRPNADELVGLGVELILAIGAKATLAAKGATSRIPIVFVGAGDPVESGLVSDLGRPGRNVTGFSTMSPQLMAKRLELLRELLPKARRAAVLVYPRNSASRVDIEASFRRTGLEAIVLEVDSPSEFNGALASAVRQGAAALLENVAGTTWEQDASLMRDALKLSLPTVTRDAFYVEHGGLAALMLDEHEQYRAFAYYLDRILRGAKAGDLPVQQPGVFRTVVNLRTARALGVTVAPAVIARADRVIE
jgi:putative tryptophan/tyrosine transport system substrate-binding protein